MEVINTHTTIISKYYCKDKTRFISGQFIKVMFFSYMCNYLYVPFLFSTCIQENMIIHAEFLLSNNNQTCFNKEVFKFNCLKLLFFKKITNE